MYTESIFSYFSRFRWAICQVEILRRLKPQKQIVKKTLAALPKTLYATYDALFQAISDDERLFVYLALRWIVFTHSVEGGGSIPYRVLTQAVEESIFHLTGSPSERFYDREVLADVCGCLINIRSEPLFSMGDGKDPKKYFNDGVSFAHYTVSEYLDANTNLHSQIGLQSSPSSQVLWTFIFEKANEWLSEERREIDWLENGFSSTLMEEFPVYSLPLACSCDEILAESLLEGDENLQALVIKLFDPSNINYETFADLIRMLSLNEWSVVSHLQWFSSTIDPIGSWFGSEEAEHLFNLLQLPYDGSKSPIVERYLQREDIRNVLYSQCGFSKEIADWVDGEAPDAEFKGSLIEICAQGCFVSYVNYERLLEIGAGTFDPSYVFLLFIGMHCRLNLSDGSEVFELLTKYGGDPNYQLHGITLLQVAVAGRNTNTVKELLKVGARPNDVPYGPYRPITHEKSPLNLNFRCVQGLSPLIICRENFQDYSGPHVNPSLSHPPSIEQEGQIEEEGKTIEDMLLSHGAEGFIRRGCWADHGADTEYPIFEEEVADEVPLRSNGQPENKKVASYWATVMGNG